MYPGQTHSYFVDGLLCGGLTSLRTDVLSRYRGYLLQLRNSPSCEVMTMSNIVMRDVRSVTGANVKYLEDATKMDPLAVSKTAFKDALSSFPAQPDESDLWRVPLLGKLLQQRGEYY